MTQSNLINVNDIRINAQVRTFIGAKGLGEMVNSIKTLGVLQPILVTVNNDDAEYVYTLVAGERRLTACKELGFAKIPAIVVEEKQAANIQLVENIQRENLSLADTAKGVSTLCETSSQKAVAEQLGKSTAWVSKMYAIHNHLGSVAEALMRDGITKDIELLGLLSKIESMEGSEWALNKLDADIRNGSAGRKEAQDVYDKLKNNAEQTLVSAPLSSKVSTFIEQVEQIAELLIAEAIADGAGQADQMRCYCDMLQQHVDELVNNHD
ncbi:MAG: ParB/RepB/Spo0J family partition protein [Nitrosomonas sp.]|nr:ParB/RepB/Spo0J family partition protein [Nitrosomonas sp.]